MKQLNNFIEKASYVSPSCKSVVLRSNQTILASSYGDVGHAGGRGGWIEEDEDY